MKTVELKQLNIENYKKFEAVEYQFAPRTMVSGRNRQGKTTLMDAYFDTLTGKLADGTSPNNVRRKEDGEEVEGVVSRELTLLIDGEETVIRKETKKGKSSSTTKYQVDGFDYNQTKYKDFLKRIADPEIIMMCSNAKAFLNELQKSTAEARKTLTDMSGFDADAFMRSTPEIMQITKGHPVEETAKQLKKDKKNKQEDIKDKASKIEAVKKQEIPDAAVLEEKREQVLNHLIGTRILYMSGSKEHLLELFDSQPVGFLEKPLTREKVNSGMDRILRQMEENSFCYRSGRISRQVPYREIL